MDWNDLKVLLVLIRMGNVRAAANELGISHSTVARKVESLESRVGVKLLVRQPGGYHLTPAGADMIEVAEKLEKDTQALQLRITGQDKQLSGAIKLSMVDVYASHLMMSVLSEFCQKYPKIDICLDITYKPVDLNKREADIALRSSADPPDHLIAKFLGNAVSGIYAHKDYSSEYDLSDPESANWVGYGSLERFPLWVKNSPYPHLPAKGNFNSMSTQLEAIKQKMGLGFLPCFLCDKESSLIRIHPDLTTSTSANLWLLRHPSTRFTTRLQTLSEFIAKRVQDFQPRLSGQPE